MNDIHCQDAISVTLPDLHLDGFRGWLCTVCLRVVLPDRRPWSWFGCESCRQVDAQIAGRYGARRLLPLGQHSIMNGTGLRLDVDDDSALSAAFDEFLALGRGWSELREWKLREGARLVTILQERLGHVPDSVAISIWHGHFPPGEDASVDAYDRLLATRGALPPRDRMG